MILKKIWFVILFSATCKSQSEFCTFMDKSECYAKINCFKRIENVDEFINNWQCYYNDRYYNDRRNVFLDVKLENIDSLYNLDPLVSFQPFNFLIENLWISNSNIVTVPSQVYMFHNMRELNLAQNTIENFDLSKLVSLNYLQIVNVSYNMIIKIDNKVVLGTNISLVTTIDFSHNLIESIEDNSFSKYIKLQYLDMSHNLITNFDILTFEGITSLETLNLSNNRIKEIGYTFLRFKNLKTLKLDYNHISKISSENFKTLTSLVNLNLKSNDIKEIEDKSFDLIQDLEELDLSNNKISIISINLFQNNINLLKLQLCYNDIQKIEPNSFKNAHITEFLINNNSLIGTIEENMFAGVFVTELNLRKGKLTQLGNNAFSTLGSTLISLDLSSNLIVNISVSSFQSLYFLTKLDLSSNKLYEISFNSSDLRNLTEFNLNSNNIKSIFNSFHGMHSLLKLDLSHNKLEEINPDLFIDLTNLEDLILSNNFLGNVLSPDTFNSLHKLKNLHLGNTKITLYQNDTLSGMLSLKHLNSSFGGLLKLGYDAFRDTGALEIIDLSHNMLNIFNVNTSHFKNVQELYLNDNLLTYIAAETFFNLHQLHKLNLASNNIEVIEPRCLQPLAKLNFLNLSSNNNIKIDSRLFDDLLYLSEIYVNDIIAPLSFNKSSNVSIKMLYLSFTNIIEIGAVELFRVKNIMKLVLSSNKINNLTKRSFESMPSLYWLDLSVNMINYVQPGTFELTPNINVLNLAKNCILSLEFGVLDGLQNLRNLNLSSNAIHTFSANILHNTPYLTHLSLDNNNIVEMNFSAFAIKNLQELSIGGNLISCDTLIAWNQSPLGDMIVTAEQLLYNVENIHGIRCTTLTKNNGTINQSTDVNLISYLSKLINIQQNLYAIVEKSINESTSLKKEEMRYMTSDIANELKKKFDRKEVDKNEQWTYSISNISNIWYSAFINITTIINNILLANNNITNSIKNTQNKEHNLIRSILQKNDMDMKEINTLQQRDRFSQAHDFNQAAYYLSDIRVLLYIIVICLSSTIVLLVSLICYRQIYAMCRNKRQVIINSDNPQSLANSMEL